MVKLSFNIYPLPTLRPHQQIQGAGITYII